jgi:hypothetical protein
MLSLLFVLAVDNGKTLDEQITVGDDLLFAKRNYQLGKAACCDSGTLFAQFIFNALDDTVKSAGV